MTFSALHPVAESVTHILSAANGQAGAGGDCQNLACVDSTPILPSSLVGPFKKFAGVFKFIILGVCVLSLGVWAATFALAGRRGHGGGEDHTMWLARIAMGAGVASGLVSIFTWFG